MNIYATNLHEKLKTIDAFALIRMVIYCRKPVLNPTTTLMSKNE